MNTTVSNSVEIDLSHILFHPKFVSCLICKRFFGQASTCSKYNALTHVKGKKHRQVVKSLFRNLINDPFCNTSDVKYLVVLKNLKLDISQLAQGSADTTTYIYERNDHLFCLLCQEIVSNSTDVNKIKTDLLNHLSAKIESHMCMMKDRISWIYNLNNANGFILFHKEKVYCSVCQIDLDFVEDLMLHAAVGHLQTKQHMLKLNQVVDQDLIVRAQGSAGLGLSALPKETHPEDAQIVQRFVNSNLNIDKMTLDSIRTLAQDPIFAPHVQFLTIEGANFICTLCNVPLTISTSSAHHLKTHIRGSRHGKLSAKRQIFVPNRSWLGLTDGVALIGTSPHDQIQKLLLEPKFASHVKYLQVKGRICRCLLCDITLSVSIKVNCNLKDHLLGGKHMKNFDKLHLNNVPENLKIVKEATLIRPDSTALAPVSFPLLKYVEENGDCYNCLICNATLDSEKSLKDHVQGKKHKKKVRKSVPLDDQNSTENISQFKKLAQNSVCAPHIKYLNVIGKKCQCSICGVEVPMTNSNIKTHISGAKHKKCLEKLQPDMVETRPSIDGQQSPSPLKIKTLTEDASCAPHIPYLQMKENDCYCLICCVSFPKKKKGFMLHILGANHTKRFNKLQPSKAQANNTSDDQDITPPAIPELTKLAEDPRCATHLRYFKKEKKLCRCSVCDVLVPRKERDVKAHILGSKHKNCFEKAE